MEEKSYFIHMGTFKEGNLVIRFTKEKKVTLINLSNCPLLLFILLFYSSGRDKLLS